MPAFTPRHAYWVHSSSQTKQAKIHLGSCQYCTDGTGMRRRPAVPGGPAVWTSYGTMEEALVFLARLPWLDKAACFRCLPHEQPLLL